MLQKLILLKLIINMIVTFNNLAFAFNPIMIKVEGYAGSVRLITDFVSVQRDGYNLEPIYFNLQPIAQYLFDKNNFNDVQENDNYLYKKLNFSLNDRMQNTQFEINIIWGALQVGEKYERTRTLTWFKNFPFTFPLLLQAGRGILAHFDDQPDASDWKSISDGKHNLLPDIPARRKVVYATSGHHVIYDGNGGTEVPVIYF